MQKAVAIDEMSGSQLLDHAAELATTQHRCEVEILRAAAHTPTSTRRRPSTLPRPTSRAASARGGWAETALLT